MSAQAKINFISNSRGKQVAVIVPIALWREMESEKETAYLLKSKAMKKRLLEARASTNVISYEDARAKLGI